MYSYDQKLVSYSSLSLNMFLWDCEEQSQRFHEFQKYFQIKEKFDFAVTWLLKTLAVAVLAVRGEKKKKK